jgi:hypothetical protein
LRDPIESTNFPLSGSFNPGAFASADLFIELILDPIQNGNLALEGLFEVEEKRDLSCSRHPDAPQQETRRVYIINMRRSAFDDNHVPHSDVSELLKQWFSSGLHVQSAITCCVCRAGGAEIIRLAEHSILKFPKGQAPPHLHFLLDVAAIVKPSEQKDFMGANNWPATLKLGEEEYILFARGFWNGSHFWCKVLRTVGAITGIWLHNDMENDGYACLVSSDRSYIGGTAPSTSWLMYSRAWTASETDFVDEMISKIKKDHSKATGHLPFVHLSNILRSTRPDHNSESTGTPGEINTGMPGEIDPGTPGEIDPGMLGEIDPGMLGEIDPEMPGKIDTGIPGKINTSQKPSATDKSQKQPLTKIVPRVALGELSHLNSFNAVVF